MAKVTDLDRQALLSTYLGLTFLKMSVSTKPTKRSKELWVISVAESVAIRQVMAMIEDIVELDFDDCRKTKEQHG